MDWNAKNKTFVCDVPSASSQFRVRHVIKHMQRLQTGITRRLERLDSPETQRISDVQVESQQPAAIVQQEADKVLTALQSLHEHVNDCPYFNTSREVTCTKCMQLKIDSEGALIAHQLIENFLEEYQIRHEIQYIQGTNY